MVSLVLAQLASVPESSSIVVRWRCVPCQVKVSMQTCSRSTRRMKKQGSKRPAAHDMTHAVSCSGTCKHLLLRDRMPTSNRQTQSHHSVARAYTKACPVVESLRLVIQFGSVIFQLSFIPRNEMVHDELTAYM